MDTSMNIVIVGHVDHGKSTIIGRLLADTNSLPEGKLAAVREQCQRNSKPFEYAFLLDALKDEQAQGITIDSARCFFKTDTRSYLIMDAPGHIEFLKNMVTGAARAEAALLVIDGSEGVKENSRRHGYLLSMLGVRQLVVLVNKMDLIKYSQNAFRRIVKEYQQFLKKVDLSVKYFIPVSGFCGDNVVHASEKTPWYNGPSVLDALDSFVTELPKNDQPLRLPVQDVYKFTLNEDKRRIIAGSIDAGELEKGDTLVFYPSGKHSKIQSIEGYNQADKNRVRAGYATGVTLSEQIYVTRGEIGAKQGELPPLVGTKLKVNLFWLGRRPLEFERRYLFRLGTAKVGMRLESIDRVVDASSLENLTRQRVEKHQVAEVTIQLERAVACDLHEDMPETGRFVIVDDYEITGGGIVKAVLPYSSTISWEEGKVTYHDRCRQLGQQGLVIWLTGLSGAGKSTIAIEVEKELLRQNRYVYRLDGDNLRHGLNSDLGFSETDRNENIRRIGEVAALFSDAGAIVLVACISPYQSMRQFAREQAKEFLEVYVKADVATCAGRDPKGLYQKAIKGEILNFTGITAPYEEPDRPDIVIDTSELTVEQGVQLLLEKIRKTEWRSLQ